MLILFKKEMLISEIEQLRQQLALQKQGKQSHGEVKNQLLPLSRMRELCVHGVRYNKMCMIMMVR